MKKLSVLMRLDRYELLGINRRMHDPAQRLGGKWLLALIVLAAIAAAWALGITPDVMRTGVSALGCTLPEKEGHTVSGARDIADKLLDRKSVV